MALWGRFVLECPVLDRPILDGPVPDRPILECPVPDRLDGTVPLCRSVDVFLVVLLASRV